MLENNQKEIVFIKDLGMKFPNKLSKKKRRHGLYKCFCGEEFERRNDTNIISCGCNKITHGLKYHRLYDVWRQIIQRCNNPKNKSYINYGGRGISICNDWLDISNFIKDMYPSFQEGLSIDRIDNNKGYSPDNCRWVTKEIQARNKRLIQSNNTSGYRGVSYFIHANKWTARISINSKLIHIGYYETSFDAAKAYDNFIIENGLEHIRNFS